MRGILVLGLSLLMANGAVAQNDSSPRLPPPLLEVPATGSALGTEASIAPDGGTPQTGAARTLDKRPSTRELPGTSGGAAPAPATAPADKPAAIGVLMADLQNLSPSTYDANDKLLDLLQLERLVALRDQQVNATREFALSTGGAPDLRSVQRAFALRTSIWPTTAIPVTWDVPPDVFDRYDEECEWVREAIESTWERRKRPAVYRMDAVGKRLERNPHSHQRRRSPL